MHLAFQLIYYLLKHHQKRSQWKDGKCRYVKLHKNCTENQWKQVVSMQGGGQVEALSWFMATFNQWCW